LQQVEKVVITTHESAIRIIDKRGPLHNPADRDHCLQYMTAIGLIFGHLTADHYEDKIAADPRIDLLREKMVVVENPAFSKDYLDPQKRSITNAVQVYFKDGSATDEIKVEYPLGHRKRREEGIPLLVKKFKHHLSRRFSTVQSEKILEVCLDQQQLIQYSVDKFVDLWVPWK